MAMLTAYLDESGRDGKSEALIVSGYLATQELWETFRVRWADFLAKNEIEKFHATDIQSRKREFSSWSEGRATSALRIADRLIRENTLCGVSTYAIIDACEKAFPLDIEGRGMFTFEYNFAAMKTVNQLVLWAQENGHKDPIHFVFEDGADGKGLVMSTFRHIEKDKSDNRYDLVGGNSFVKKGPLQLHAPDRLSNSTNRLVNDYYRNSEKSEDAKNRELDEMCQRLNVCSVQYFEENGLRELRRIADDKLKKAEEVVREY